jgi:hypothetical protein
MQTLLSFGLIIYFIFYAFEGVIRYGLNLVGADQLIFIRDILLVIPLVGLFIGQLSKRTVHPAYWVYFFVIILHGSVMVLNFGNVMPVIYTAKMLMTVLVGALVMQHIFYPSRRVLVALCWLWLVTLVAVGLDKYVVEMPWMGLEAVIGDVKVEISRDWQISGEEKRAAGLMRSSINAATLTPLIAIMLIFHLRRIWLRLVIAVGTVVILYWTTQKGPIVGYLLVLGCLLAMPKRPLTSLRIGFFVAMIAAVLFPVVLSGYNLDHSGGVFSFSSFNDRLVQMWPDAWRWIARHDAFPFGVGLGGISGAQRLYAKDEMNAADNMFVLMYAFFGMMSFVYLSWLSWRVIKLGSPQDISVNQAMAILVYIFGYGIVISIFEDQMASLFLGAAAMFIYTAGEKKPPLPDSTKQALIVS